MRPKVSDEIKAKILKGLYEDLMPKPPKPKVEAEIVTFPPILSEQELCRRQEILDQYWERHIAAQRELDAEAAQSCHRGPGDPDWYK
jgi:hypothetical protein